MRGRSSQSVPFICQFRVKRKKEKKNSLYRVKPTWFSKTQDHMQCFRNGAPFLVYLRGTECWLGRGLCGFYFKCSESNGAASGCVFAITATVLREHSQRTHGAEAPAACPGRHANPAGSVESSTNQDNCIVCK